MKIDRRNPWHWLSLLKSGVYVLICIPLRFLFKRKAFRPLVILYGHKLNGNLLALYRYCQSQPDHWEIHFLTLDTAYARQNPDLKPLLAVRLRDMFRVVVTADCIVTDHGLHTLLPLLYLTHIRFVDVWHGVPFKGFIPADFRVQHRYDEVWVSSPTLRRMYVENFGFRPGRLVATGYGRTDTLLHYYAQRETIRRQYGIPSGRRTILFAPTWKQDDAHRTGAPFGQTMEDFLARLEAVSAQHDAIIFVRHHLNAATGASLLGSDHLRALPANRYPDTEEILAISDCLITDWSSIAFDVMVIRKPIVFLDVPVPFKHGFALPPDCRAGVITTNVQQVEDALTSILCEGTGYLGVDETEYERVRNIAFAETLDGRSSQRYHEQLGRLLTRG